MTNPLDIKPIQEERAFHLEELFFSTTDKRGVIRYGNRVFTRIAGYTLEEMIDKPHNLIRHPDMPRSAFRLVWDYLKQDKVVGAYVKNMAHDGRFYWVFALILPTPAGYLSIRLKPSSSLFTIVQEAYKATVQAERQAQHAGASSKEVMDAGTEQLMGLLGSLGYNSYDQFLCAALSAEMMSRREKLEALDTGKTIKPTCEQGDGTRKRLIDLFRGAIDLDGRLGDVIARPATFAQLSEQIIPKADYVMGMGRNIRLQSVNAEIQAARMGDSARALAQVAEDLSMHAGSGTNTVADLSQTLKALVAPISELVFLAMVSKVQIEMATAFVHEILDAKHDATEQQNIEANLTLLFESFLKTVRQVPRLLDRLTNELARIEKSVQALERFLTTLRFVYLAGKIETAHHDNAQSFSAIFENIHRMICDAEDVVDVLMDNLQQNRKQIQKLVNIEDADFELLEALVAA